MTASLNFVQVMIHRWIVVIGALLVAMPLSPSFAQSVPPGSAPDSPPAVITLDEAIRRAQLNEPVFAAALADKKIGTLDQSIARTAFLPSVTYHNQVLYTEPNGRPNQAGQVGSQPAPIFIANNAVREYASQASINETLGLQQVAGLKAATAAAA